MKHPVEMMSEEIQVLAKTVYPLPSDLARTAEEILITEYGVRRVQLYPSDAATYFHAALLDLPKHALSRLTSYPLFRGPATSRIYTGPIPPSISNRWPVALNPLVKWWNEEVQARETRQIRSEDLERKARELMEAIEIVAGESDLIQR